MRDNDENYEDEDDNDNNDDDEDGDDTLNKAGAGQVTCKYTQHYINVNQGHTDDDDDDDGDGDNGDNDGASTWMAQVRSSGNTHNTSVRGNQ